MEAISASRIKQNTALLQNALRGDLLITKHDKPFVVVMDYERYRQLTNPSRQVEPNDWMDETFGVMSVHESDALLKDIYNARVDKP